MNLLGIAEACRWRIAISSVNDQRLFTPAEASPNLNISSGVIILPLSQVITSLCKIFTQLEPELL